MRVPGTGPVPASIMFVGEMPGLDEARTGVPFSGRAGRELERHLDGVIVPLSREEAYLTNLSKQPQKDTKAFQFDAEDAETIETELQAVAPDLIVTLGARATQYFLGDVTLEMVHGIVHAPIQHAPCLDCAIFPTYNPAAALRIPSMQALFAQDMHRLGQYLRGLLPPPIEDAWAGDYAELTEAVHAPLPAFLPADTEGSALRPWCLSYSPKPYTGFVIRPDTRALTHFIERVKTDRPRFQFHHSLHDLAVMRSLGIDLDALELDFDDTMIAAYLLGLEPQGLKPLLYRHAGMIQQAYLDLVEVPGEVKARIWLTDLTKQLAAHGDPQVQKAVKLVTRMLDKADTNGKAPRPIVARWQDGRAREILQEETGVLSTYANPPEATLDDIPLTEAVQYAGRDADGTGRIAPRLLASIDAFDLRDVYEVDLGIVPMVDRMQTIGMGVDVEYFRGLSTLLEMERQENLRQIERAIGRPLNPNSGDQVAALLFDDLQIHRGAPNLRLKKTEGGRFSTDDKTLQALEEIDPTGIVHLITEGREIKKIKGTFADPMPTLVGLDRRLHPNLRITRTDTGRLAAGDPNILAFPKHSARGKLVRMGFCAGPDRELGEWDLDQVEMRVFAHDSGDEHMLEEFSSGKDKHASTAARIFNEPYDTLYAAYKAGDAEADHKRFCAKAVNFGVLMGITEFGLLNQMHKNGQLDATLDGMVTMLREWERAYPQGVQYRYRKHAEARRYGYVRDMWKRLRWLEGVRSTDEWVRAEALRMAQATPIQSGAQGIIKRIMRALWPELKALRQQGIWVECLLQIHDALLLEFDKGARAHVNAVVMRAMQETVTLKLPITAKAKYGDRWGEL